MHMKTNYSHVTRSPRPLAEADRSLFYPWAWVLAAPLLLAWLWCAGHVSAAEYEVGPGKPYARIIDCPTHDLAAGDSILVHYRSEPYREKFLLHGVGTAEQPITLKGVPDASGNKPVIDGEDAVSSMAVDYWHEDRQIIKIGQYTSHHSNHIIVDGFVFRNANNTHTFIDDQGVASLYGFDTRAIRPEYARNVVIRNCEFTNNGGGFQRGAIDIGALEAFALHETEPSMAANFPREPLQDDDGTGASPSGGLMRHLTLLMQQDLLFDHMTSFSQEGGHEGGFLSRLASTIMDGDLILAEGVSTINNVPIRGELLIEGSSISMNLNF